MLNALKSSYYFLLICLYHTAGMLNQPPPLTGHVRDTNKKKKKTISTIHFYYYYYFERNYKTLIQTGNSTFRFWLEKKNRENPKPSCTAYKYLLLVYVPVWRAKIDPRDMLPAPPCLLSPSVNQLGEGGGRGRRREKYRHESQYVIFTGTTPAKRIGEKLERV